MKYDKRIAFTLAEVLIVLGIIGVVAALTIPTLTKNYQKQITLTRVKQTYSMFAQALKLSEIDHDNIGQWNIPSVTATNASHAATSKAFADEYFVKYLKGVQSVEASETSSYKGVAWYKFQNGVRVYIWPRGTWGEIGIYTSDAKTYISGKNNFVLVFIKTASNAFYGKTATGGIYFYGYGQSRNTLKNDSSAGCNNKSATYYGLYCGALIQTDSWKISDDYYWR